MYTHTHFLVYVELFYPKELMQRKVVEFSDACMSSNFSPVCLSCKRHTALMTLCALMTQGSINTMYRTWTMKSYALTYQILTPPFTFCMT